MRIIIVGCGKVGFTLAQNLSSENYDVIIIDNDDDVLKRVSDTLDVLCVKGSGASSRVLREAGVSKTDVFIAATSRDELNMLCCLTAKKLGAAYTIARIRDYEYTREINQLKNELDIDMAINPEFATSTQILRLLRFPNALDIETFYRGRIELVGFKVISGDIIAGQPLSVIRKRIGNIPILFCAVEHNGKIIIPHGDTVFEQGDKVYVIGEIFGINRFFKSLGRITQRIKNVFIIGGGRIGLYLAHSLSNMNMNVKLVEPDSEKCVKLCEILPKVLIINGDGTDQELLMQENLKNSDAFVALTGRDEENLITSLYAKQSGVPKVIAKINRQNYFGIIGGLGLDSVISPKLITAYLILQKVRAMQNSQGSRMEALYQIANGDAEAMEFIISPNTNHLKIQLRNLNLKKGILIAVIMREGNFIIPEGSDYIDSGDDVIIISSGTAIHDINDIYEE